MNEPHPTQSGGHPFGRLLRFVLPSFGYMGLRFLLNPLRMRLLTQYLPKDLYGSLTLATTTLTFIAILSSLGGLEFLLRRLPGMTPGRQHGLLRMILVRLALPGWLATGLLGAGVKAMGWLPALPVADLLLMWLALGLTSWLSYRIYYSLGSAKLMLVRIIQLLQNDLWFVGIVAAGAWAAASLTHSLWIWTGWLFLVAVGIAFWARLPAEIERPKENIRSVLHYGVPLLPMIVGEVLFRLADRYVLLGFHGIELVADYTLSMNIAMMVFVTGSSVMDLATPQLYAARNRKPEGSGPEPTGDMRRLFSIMLRHMWGLSLPAGLALAIFHRDIFQILSGPAFRDASVLLPWMAFIPGVYLSVEAANRALLTMDRSRLVGGATFGAAFLNLGVNMLVAPHWGGMGVAAATLLSMTALMVFLNRTLNWRVWVLREELRPGSIALATLVCLVGFAALRWGCPGLGAWLRLLLGGTIAGAALIGARIFVPGEIAPLRPAGPKE